MSGLCNMCWEYIQTKRKRQFCPKCAGQRRSGKSKHYKKYQHRYYMTVTKLKRKLKKNIERSEL